MTGYIIRRIMGMIPVLLVIIAINFFLGHAAPGNPIMRMYNEQLMSISDEQLQKALEHYGLNRPILVQFWDYLANLAQGDFGRSILSGQPVIESIAKVLPISLQIGVAASVVTFMVGIPLGILAALRQNSRLDYLVVGGSLFIRTVPIFVLAPMLLLLLVMKLDVFPVVPFGWKGLFNTNSILPVLLMAIGPMAVVIRQMRAGVLDVLAEDYVRTAKAKGLPNHAVIVRHVMRNALLPVITSMGFVVMGFLRGSLFVDIIFGIPGFGRLSVNAVLQLDYPVIMGCALFGSLIVMLTNLMTDLIYPLLDARVVYGKGRG